MGSKNQRNIALFGGSFNPLHYGHLKIVEKSVLHHALDQVIFIPSYQSPHKSNKDWVSPILRIEAIEQVIDHEDCYRCHDYEAQREKISYTIDTVTFFCSQYPFDRLFWIMGYDQWINFERWKDYQNILKMVELIVCFRCGYHHGRKEAVAQKRVHLISDTNFTMNSNDIRLKIAQGLCVKNDIPQAIMDWIKKYRLYGYRF